MKRRFITAALTLALASSLLAGCSSNTTDTAQTTTADATAATQASAETTAGDGTGEPVTITIWYEGNDTREPFFDAIEAEMQKDYPNYSIETVTFDNSTLTSKGLQAITATGGVDLIYNEATRLLQMNLQSGGAFTELDDVLADAVNHEVVTESDRKLTTQNGQLMVFPTNRSMSGLGVKLDVPGVEVTEDKMPSDWDKFVALGKEYKSAGLNGFTMHLGTDPGQVFSLFMIGSGMSDIWLNETPESQVADKQKYYEDIVSLYAGPEAFYDLDAVNEDFATMYTKIQSSSVGMFRVGNWNAGGWDAADSGVGEYTVTTWPSMDGQTEGGLVLSGVRGFALADNAPNAEAAKTFLKYALTEEAQKASFEVFGSCVDVSVVDQDTLTPNQKIFFDPNVPLYAFDSYASNIEYYPALLEVYEKGLLNAFSATNEEEISSRLAQLHEEVNKAIEANK